MTELETMLDNMAGNRRISLTDSRHQNIPFAFVGRYAVSKGASILRVKSGKETRPRGGMVRDGVRDAYDSGFLYAAIDVSGLPWEIAYGFNSKRDVMLVSKGDGLYELLTFDCRDWRVVKELKEQFSEFFPGYRARPETIALTSPNSQPVFKLFEYLLRYKA